MVFGTADKIKQAAEESKIYDAIVDNLYETAKIEAGGQGTQLPLDDPAIEKAAKSAFSTELIQKNSTQVIDNVYSWLKQDLKTPNFVVDFSEAKVQLADSLAQYAQDRYEGLPECTLAQLRSLNTSSDLMNIGCRVPLISGDEARNRVKAELLNSPNFLKDTTFTVEDLPKDPQGMTVFEKAADAPRAFGIASALPVILLFVSVLLAIGVVLLAQTKLIAMKSLGLSLTGVGVFLAIDVFIITWLFKQMNSSSVGEFQNSMLALIRNLTDEYVKALLVYCYVFIGTGAALLLASWLIRKRRMAAIDKQLAEVDELPVATEASAEVTENKPTPEVK